MFLQRSCRNPTENTEGNIFSVSSIFQLLNDRRGKGAVFHYFYVQLWIGGRILLSCPKTPLHIRKKQDGPIDCLCMGAYRLSLDRLFEFQRLIPLFSLEVSRHQTCRTMAFSPLYIKNTWMLSQASVHVYGGIRRNSCSADSYLQCIGTFKSRHRIARSGGG